MMNNRLPKVWLEYFILFESLWDRGRGKVSNSVPRLLPGVCVDEWLALARCDYDEVDRFLIDLETIGG